MTKRWATAAMTMLLVAAAFSFAPVVAAQPNQRANQRGGADASSAVDAAAMMPADSELVLVIENGRELRQTALGAAGRSLFGIGGTMEGAGGPWRGLAKQLGWAELDAFDRLLGQRVVLVARGIADPATARWALVSQVSADTSRRLKERLAISPRVIDKGQQIFALEQGRYELTMHTAPVRRVVRADDRSVTLILAPTGRAELLDEVLTSLNRGKAQTLVGQSVIDRAAAMGATELLLLARLGGRMGGEDPVKGPWPNYVIVSARRTDLGGRGWQAKVALREQSRREALRAAAESTDGAFEALRKGSLLTIVQRAPLESILGTSLPIDDPLSKLPWPARARELFTGAQAIRIGPIYDRDPNAATGKGIVCTLAMETGQIGELAEALDDPVARFFGLIEQQAINSQPEGQPVQQQWAGPSQSTPEFSGLLPRATRVMSIDLAKSSPLAAMTGQGLTTAWVYSGAADREAGWWTLSISGRGADSSLAPKAVREAGRALVTGNTEGDRRKWIWLLAARPQELDRMLPPALPDYRGMRSAMRRLTDIVCRLSITPDGDIEGDLIIEVAAEAAGR